MASVLSPNVRIVSGGYTPLGFQQIALTSTAGGLTPPTGARLAVIDAEIQNVRYRDDGVNPTATVGMRILADTELRYSGNLTAIKFVVELAGAVINVSYYA